MRKNVINCKKSCIFAIGLIAQIMKRRYASVYLKTLVFLKKNKGCMTVSCTKHGLLLNLFFWGLPRY